MLATRRAGVGAGPSDTAPAAGAALALIEPLIVDEAVREPSRGGRLPTALRARYGGDAAIPLRSDRPTVIVNFVTTLDGVVSYNTPEAAGGGEISGFFEPDRFVMGLLRALADVVLVGAGTLRAGGTGLWTADYIHPSSAPAFRELRASLGLPEQPAFGVVTRSGEIDTRQAGIADPRVPVVLLTTDRGARRLAGRQLGNHVEVIAAGDDSVEPDVLLEALGRRGAELVLCEGGPQLLASMLSARVVDELFLTIAPQVAGRSADVARLALIEGHAFPVDEAPWARLVDLRRSRDHLFTRYRFERERRAED